MKPAPQQLVGLEPERYEFRALPMHQFALGRRDFFKIFGAGLAVFAVVKNVSAMQETAPAPHGYHPEELPKEIGAWLHIGEDGKVTGFVGKAEIGQNVRTSLAQTLADELGVPFDSVQMVLGDTALTPFDAGTFGSRSTPTMTPQLRKMAAAARTLLIEKAAKQWNVPVDNLVAGDGKILDPASGKSLRYAELVREDIGLADPPAGEKTKPASQWAIAGQPIAKVDARAFVTGAHRYTTDLRPEGMLYGKVLRPPSFGATLVSYDDSATKEMKDVVLVRDGDFVAAAAPTVAGAQAALAKLSVQWKEVPQISDKEIFTYLKNNAEPLKNEHFRSAKGSVTDGLAAAAHKLESELHGCLYCARSAGAARGRGAVGWREAHRVDGNATAVCRARRSGGRVSRDGKECARDRAGYRLRLRRETHQRCGPGSSASGTGDGGASSETCVDARGRIHVGVFPARGRD